MLRVQGFAKAAIISLVASLLAVMPITSSPALATPIPNNITFNNQVCDLSTALYQGDGSEANPYLIPDADALWEVTDCSVTNSAPAYFELTNDITVSDAVKAPTSSPIGVVSNSLTYSFSGVLDGKGFEISGISISSSVFGVGLFGHLEDSSIRHLALSGNLEFGISIDDSRAGAGALANYAAGNVLIESLTNSATVSGGFYVGGLLGKMETGSYLTISNSVNEGNVSGSVRPIGGLVGEAYQAHIVGSKNYGAVESKTGSDSRAGGLIGEAKSSIRISESQNYATVVGLGEYVGGLVGMTRDASSVVNSINHADATGKDFVGGLVGNPMAPIDVTGSQNRGNVEATVTADGVAGGFFGLTSQEVSISNSVNQGAISSSKRAGGLIGQVGSSAFISDSTNSGTVSSQAVAGGLIAFVSSNVSVTLSNVANSGEVSGLDGVGGLVGQAERTAVSGSLNIGPTDGRFYVGGLVGLANKYIEVHRSSNEGEAKGHFYVGGMVGQSSTASLIVSASNAATISGGYRVGGAIGNAIYDSTIDSFQNSGRILGVGGSANEIGGLVGASSRVSVSSSKNIATVSGYYSVGGFVGRTNGFGQIYESENRGLVSGNNEVGGFVGNSNHGTSFSAALNEGRISASSYVGGFVGEASAKPITIVSSQNSGPVSSNTDGTFSSTGGFIGYAPVALDILLSTNSGSVTAFSNGDWVGGFAGYVNTITVTNSHNLGAVTGYEDVGGLAGQAATAHLFGASNRNIVTGEDLVGGLVGYLSSGGSADQSYNTGYVDGQDSVGGLFGSAYASVSVSSSFNASTVSGRFTVGGILGNGDNATVIFQDVYNSGVVSGSSIVGGLVGGTVQATTSVLTTYNVGEVFGSANTEGIVGRFSASTMSSISAVSTGTSRFISTSAVADMKKASTFTSFDFTNTWGFGSCTDNQGFPLLRVFAQISNYNSVACGYTPPLPQQPVQDAPAPAPVTQPMPVIDQTRIETSAGTEHLLTGERFDLIRSASINGLEVTISQLTPTSLVIEIPELEAGTHSLDLQTTNGRISYQGLIKIAKLEVIETQEVSTSFAVTGLNPRSSWLNKTALAELEEIFTGKSVVTCISYNDRPGLVSRQKALSRAMHACRFAEQQGIETRVFVYGKAPQLADTVKILFR